MIDGIDLGTIDPAAADPAAPTTAPGYRQALSSIAQMFAWSATPDAAALNAAVEDVLAQCEPADASAEIEVELATMAAQFAPRSDSFIPRIVEFFRWRSIAPVDDARVRGAIGYCVQRGRDLDYLDDVCAKGARRRALRELHTPPRNVFLKGIVFPGMMDEVQAMLTTIPRDHPTLAAEFPPGALDAWTAQFAGSPASTPRAPLSLIVVLILALGVIVGAASAYRPAHAQLVEAKTAPDPNHAIMGIVDLMGPRPVEPNLAKFDCFVHADNTLYNCRNVLPIPLARIDSTLEALHQVDDRRIPEMVEPRLFSEGSLTGVIVDLNQFPPPAKRLSERDAADALLERIPPHDRGLVLDCGLDENGMLIKCQAPAVRGNTRGFGLEERVIAAARDVTPPINLAAGEAPRALVAYDLGPASAF